MSATYGLLGLAVTAAALLAINIAASAMAMGATVLVAMPRRSAASANVMCLRATASGRRATLLFLLRISPALLAIAIVALLFVPSYVKYEPARTSERIGPMLALLAVAALGMAIVAMWRTVRCWRATRRLVHHWRQVARPLDLGERQIHSWQRRAYRFEHPFPVVAVVGAIRPKLFVSEAVLEVLSDEELAAAVAHERAHVAAADNFRRVLMRGASDVFGLSSFARCLDRLWAEAAETAADEAVAQRGRDAALALAAALIKISRLIPPGPTPALPIAPAAAFLIAPGSADATADGDAPAGVASRVRRLLEVADTTGRPASLAERFVPRSCIFGRSGSIGTASGLLRLTLVGGITLILALSTAALAPRALESTYAAIEQALPYLD